MRKKAGTENLEEIANLAILMWTDTTVHDLIDDFKDLISKGDIQFFLKYDQDKPIGFAQCQLRYDYVEEPDLTFPLSVLL